MWVCTDKQWGRICTPNCGGGPSGKLGLIIRPNFRQQNTGSIKDGIRDLLKFFAAEVLYINESLDYRLEEKLKMLPNMNDITSISNLDELINYLDVAVMESAKSSGIIKRSIYDNQIDSEDFNSLPINKLHYHSYFDDEEHHHNTTLQKYNDYYPHLKNSSYPRRIKGNKSYVYRIGNSNRDIKGSVNSTWSHFDFSSLTTPGQLYICSSATGHWHPSYLSARPVCTSKFKFKLDHAILFRFRF